MTRKVKRGFAGLFTAFLSVSILLTFGCRNNKVTVEEYPQPVVIDSAEDDTKTDPADEKDKEADLFEKYAEYLKPETNPFEEEGKYSYNPLVIPDWILDCFKDNPKVIKAAKEVLLAVDNCDTKVTLSAEDELTAQEIQSALVVASLSNPMVSSANFTSVDGDENIMEITYFSVFVVTGVTEYGGFDAEEGASLPLDESRELFEDFKTYVTDTINKCVTAEDTEADMAFKIYKQLIVDMEYEIPENNFIDYGSLSEGDEVYSAGGCIKSTINRKFTSQSEYSKLYSFFLTQLHIDCIYVSGQGIFSQEMIDLLGDGISNYYWSWHIICADGKYYNCDLNLERLVMKASGEDNKDSDPDVQYFGMSDKTRRKSFKGASVGNADKDIILYGYYSYNQPSEALPECTEDYVY